MLQLVYKLMERNKKCKDRDVTKRKTDKEFKQEVFSLVKDEYVFLEPYQGAMNKIKVRHNECGNVYKARPSNFLRGDRCPYCNGNHKKNDIQFQHEVYNLVGDSYTVLDPYINAKTKIRVKHNKCGNVYEVTPNNFFTGNRCPVCVNKHRVELITMTNDEFIRRSYSTWSNEYTILGNYINANTKIRVKHNKCGNIYMARPADFLRGHGCPYCNSPKGELIILKILDNLNINYDYQKTFDNLKDKDYLSYDFYIPSQSILIEYQGIQHYQPVDHFGGETKFKNQQKHDQIKLDYAKEHGYNLITVPYTEDNFSKIKKYLFKHGLK